MLLIVAAWKLLCVVCCSFVGCLLLCLVLIVVVCGLLFVDCGCSLCAVCCCS